MSDQLPSGHPRSLEGFTLKRVAHFLRFLYHPSEVTVIDFHLPGQQATCRTPHPTCTRPPNTPTCRPALGVRGACAGACPWAAPLWVCRGTGLWVLQSRCSQHPCARERLPLRRDPHAAPPPARPQAPPRRCRPVPGWPMRSRCHSCWRSWTPAWRRRVGASGCGLGFWVPIKDTGGRQGPGQGRPPCRAAACTQFCWARLEPGPGRASLYGRAAPCALHHPSPAPQTRTSLSQTSLQLTPRHPPSNGSWTGPRWPRSVA